MASPVASWPRIGWPVLLLVVLGFVGSDFVRHPFRPFQPRADAAETRGGLRLSIAGTEADGSVVDVTHALAEVLSAQPASARSGPRRRTTAERLDGATTTAVESVLGLVDGSERRLLVLTPQTLVQLQRDRNERIVPGVAVRAERAWRQLVRAQPIALIAADPLVLTVRGGSRIRTVAQLSRGLRAAPGHRVFGLEDDSWTRAALASLVRASGVEGTVTYRPFGSAREAAIAVADGEVDVLVSTRTTSAAVPPQNGLRQLTGRWPGTAPARWIALVAPPSMPASETAGLRVRVARALRTTGWRRALRGYGLVPFERSEPLGPFLARERRYSAELNATLASVDISAGG